MRNSGCEVEILDGMRCSWIWVCHKREEVSDWLDDSCLVLMMGSQFSEAVQIFGFCGTGLRTSLGSSCSIGATAWWTWQYKEGISDSPPFLKTPCHRPWLADIVVQLGKKTRGSHQNHITSSGYRDHKFWSGILRAKRKLEDAANRLTCCILDMKEMKEREVWVKLHALLEIIAGKNAVSMLWQVSPSRRSDQCSTREHDNSGIGHAVPMQSYC